jgi:hypothetical protein
MPRVVAATCPDCGGALRVQQRALRETMQLTCRCGWRGAVRVDPALLRNAPLPGKIRPIEQRVALRTAFSEAIRAVSAHAIPSRCGKCHKELDAAAQVRCDRCGKLFSPEHMRLETVRVGSSQRYWHVCGRCSVIGKVVVLAAGLVLLLLLIGIPAVSEHLAARWLDAIDESVLFYVVMAIIGLGTLGRFVLWTKGRAEHEDIRLLVLGLLILIGVGVLAVQQWMR